MIPALSKYTNDLKGLLNKEPVLSKNTNDLESLLNKAPRHVVRHHKSPKKMTFGQDGNVSGPMFTAAQAA